LHRERRWPRHLDGRRRLPRAPASARRADLTRRRRLHDRRRLARASAVDRGHRLHAGRRRTGEAAVAFSMFPVSVGELMDIADAGEIMPPKSTWFEPKLRDGLLTHLI